MRHAWAVLDKLSWRQDKIAHRHQLVSCGVTPDALQWRVKTGRWRRVLPGVYALFSGALTRRQELIAAMLYAGPDSRITGLTALELYGLRYARRERHVHMVLPHHIRLASTGFVTITRTRRADRGARPNGILVVSSPARAAADAVRPSGSLNDVRAVLAEIVQCGLCFVGDLRRELENGPRAGSARLREALAEIDAGVRSAPEGELRRLTQKSLILPEILWNPILADADGTRLPTPDGYLLGIALEVDSKAHHTSPADWERTMRRHNILAKHGILVLHFSPARIRQEPLCVLAEIERAYLDRGRLSSAGTLVALPRSSGPPGTTTMA